MYQDLEASVQVGQVLASKYRVDRVLGVGGMGVVVAATHLQLDQVVALKFIRRDALMSSEIVSRFEREARAAVRLKSEHVARIIDVGRLETGSPYIVMEYLEGQDLAALLQQHVTLSVPVACDYIIQACDAIAEAHSLGIVHRDLKPGNLFLASTSHGQQTVKVLDFGISKSYMPAGDLNMTRTQAVMGSPGYMSPEQMRSAKNVDGRTDVWSLGVILYELVVGRVPFHADTFTALCLKIAMDPLPALPALPVALPPGFDAIIHRALEKDPARRYPSAVELAQALAPFANADARERAYRLVALTTGVPSAPRTIQATAAVSTLDAATGEAQARPASHGQARKLQLAGVGIAIAAVISVGVAWTRGAGGTGGGATDPVAPAREPSDPVQAPPRPPPDTRASATPPDAGTPSAPKPLVLDGGSDKLVVPGDAPGDLRKPRSGDKSPSKAKAAPPPVPDLGVYSTPD